jgi:hypothetical protein
MPSCQRADARCLSSHPRLRADGRTVARDDPRRSAPPQPRVTRRREEREETEAHPTKAPSSRPRGSAAGRTDAVRQARRQEGMRGSGDLRMTTIPRRSSRRQASPRAWSYPCPPASALTRAVCPPIRACARTGGRSRWPTVLPAAQSAAGRTDAVRQARRQEGMRGSGDLRTTTIPRRRSRQRARGASAVRRRGVRGIERTR